MPSARLDKSQASVWHGLRRDTAWQLAERGTRIGFGFVLSILIARTLGPSTFGVYSYALAIIALFAFLGQAGVDALLLRELVREPSRSARTLSESLTIRIIGSTLAGIASIATVLFAATRALHDAPMLVAILTLSGLFQAGWVVESWLQANHCFKQVALAKMAAYTVSAILRLVALTLPQPLFALAAATVIESALCTLLMWKVSARDLSLGISHLRLPQSASLVGFARMVSPMLLSGLTVAIYSRIDVFMLGRMLGSDAAGLYSAGSLLSEGFYLIPAAVMAAAAPRLTALFNHDQLRFERGLHALLRALSAGGLLIAIVITWLAPFLVPVIFGHEFQAATGILQIHIWSTWIVFVSTASDPWYINHDLRRLYLLKTSSAAALNVLLNFLLIPHWHGEGAALATVLAYGVSAFAVGAFWRQTRPLFRMQMRAIIGLGAGKRNPKESTI